MRKSVMTYDEAKEMGGDISDKSFEYADFDDFGAEQYFQPIFDL